MRQVIVHTERGRGRDVLQIADKHGAVNVSLAEAVGRADEAIDVSVVHLPNAAVGEFIDEIGESARVTLIPRGVLTLHPPAGEAPDEVKDVTHRSPIEIFIAGLQAVGSWRAFVSYAVLAGVVVWLGLFTDTAYLLVAAMLIAPYGGPAMNAAVATARGDGALLKQSVTRYFSALAITAAVAWLLSMLFAQDTATASMATTSNISTAAVVLPLAAGAAGALHLCHDERNSLVSGAAVGMLVAASIAPPAGVVGMGMATGDYPMASAALFLLGLQLVGINLSGAVVFRMFGLAPEGPRYRRGRKWVSVLAGAATLAGLAAAMALQFGTADPELERSTIEQRIRADVLSAVERHPAVAPVEVEATFTRPEIGAQNTLLVRVFVQELTTTAEGAGPASEGLARSLEAEIARTQPGVTPLVHVTVLRRSDPASAQ